jgi:hypothetical protein
VNHKYFDVLQYNHPMLYANWMQILVENFHLPLPHLISNVSVDWNRNILLNLPIHFTTNRAIYVGRYGNGRIRFTESVMFEKKKNTTAFFFAINANGIRILLLRDKTTIDILMNKSVVVFLFSFLKKKLNLTY